MLKSVLLNIFVETVTHLFQDSLMYGKGLHLFKMSMFFNITIALSWSSLSNLAK